MIDLDNTAKYSLVAVGGALGLYLLYRVGVFDRTPPGADVFGNIQATPTDDDYLRAQVWHEAMRECWRTFALDEMFLQNAEHFQSNEDVKRLYKAFGVRPYDKCVAGFPEWLYLKRDLWQWMYAVSDEDERERVNEFFANNNITYTL